MAKLNYTVNLWLNNSNNRISSVCVYILHIVSGQFPFHCLCGLKRPRYTQILITSGYDTCESIVSTDRDAPSS